MTGEPSTARDGYAVGSPTPIALGATAADATARAKIVAVASGKGGTGKTFVAISIAHAMARSGLRILIVDGDLGLANIDVQLGLVARADLEHVFRGGLSLAAAITRHAAGFDVLAGRSGSGALAGVRTAALDGALSDLRDLASHYDCVLLDLGAGLDDRVRRLADFADALLLVITEDPTSLTDGYAVLKLDAAGRPQRTPSAFSAAGGSDWWVLVNQASSHAAGVRAHATLARATAAFLARTPRFAGTIRRDERVRDAIRRQSPLLERHPLCGAALDVEAVADTLLRSTLLTRVSVA